MGFFDNFGTNKLSKALTTSTAPGGMPAWLAALGATDLPGGGFGGNKSFRVGNDVYTGSYTPGNPEGGVGPAFVGDFYKYGYNQNAFAGQGSVLNGTPYEKLDMSGKVVGSGKWEGIQNKKYGMDNAVVAIVGSILGGAAAFAGAGAGAGAAAAGGTEAAAATGLSYTAAGAPVFGVVDTTVGAGLSYTAAGAPVFGVVDSSFAAGPGISYTAGGAPVFGAVDTGVAEAGRAAAAAGSGAGGAGGGGGGASGPGAGVTKAASQLGLSQAVDKLGGQVLSAGVSSLVGDLMSPKPDMAAPTIADIPRTADTKTKAVSEMPDPLAQQRSRKRSIIEQLGRRGRSSTVMTRSSGRLGG